MKSIYKVVELIDFLNLKMSTTEKFCLKWNDFQENLTTTFESLLEDSDFADVTLTCEDGQPIEAHKIVLAASSPIFKSILKANKHQHPVIYMRGVKFDDLLSVIAFAYHGQTMIGKENIHSFLSIAEELKMKGIDGGMKTTNARETEDTNIIKTHNILDSNKDIIKEYTSNQNIHKNTLNDLEIGESVINQSLLTKNSHNVENICKKFPQVIWQVDQIPENLVLKAEPQLDSLFEKHVMSEFKAPVDLKELDDMIQSQMSRGEKILIGSSKGFYRQICNVCGKDGMGSTIKDHIETKHIVGVSRPCGLCEKSCPSRGALKAHMRIHHKQ